MIIAIIVIVCFPIYWMFVASINSGGRLYSYPPPLIPTKIDLSGYVNAVTEQPIMQWLLNTIIFTVISTIYTIIVSVPASYALSRMSSRVNEIGAFLTLAVRMAPATLLVVPLYLMFAKMKLIDSGLALIISYTTFSIPFAIWMLNSFFESIPRDLEEAAMVDGCTKLGAMTRVVVPLALPGISATTLFCIVVAWSEFLFSRTFVSSNAARTINVGITFFIGQYGVQWNEILAASVISTLPLIIAFLFLERYLVVGLTAGAIK